MSLVSYSSLLVTSYTFTLNKLSAPKWNMDSWTKLFFLFKNMNIFKTRYSKKENAILLYFEKPFKQALIVFLLHRHSKHWTTNNFRTFTDLIYTLAPWEVGKWERTNLGCKEPKSVSFEDEAFSLQRAVDDFQMILALYFRTLSPCESSFSFKTSIKSSMSLW